ncbi:MAG: magnesium transporter, partial [Planctomycetes bacterium]|nr:magnesium transporter [Planctomycetota bacterium]
MPPERGGCGHRPVGVRMVAVAATPSPPRATHHPKEPVRQGDRGPSPTSPRRTPTVQSNALRASLRRSLPAAPRRRTAAIRMRYMLLIPEIRELLAEGNHQDLVSVLQEMHPTDAAGVLSALSIDEIAQIFALLPPQFERDVFGYLEPDVQEQYVAGAGRERVQQALLAMLSDDRAEFLERFEPRVRDQLITMLPTAAREDLKRRGTFRDDQVGAFLSTDYAVLHPNLTARAAILELRRQAPSRETIYYSYVLDRAGKLVGFMSLRDLILADEARLVGDIMKTDLVSVSAQADQEEAARVIRDYDLIALPVVDGDGR